MNQSKLLIKNFLILITLISCNEVDKENDIKTIAFGSCAHQNSSQHMWKDVIEREPDLWVWTGDNVYSDTEDMAKMQADYQKQKSNPDYQELLTKMPVVGTWDDHDYGVNDGGKHYPKKEESQNLLLDFLDVPQDAEVRKREGVYQSYTYGDPAHEVKVILLDTRYFRDDLLEDTLTNARYAPNPEGDMLGEEQWKWLENELKNSQAKVHLIASGVQILADQHGFEKWANLPKSRERLYDLIADTKPNNVVFLSGDRHIAEVMKTNIPDYPYAIHEFTSSGLTHTWHESREEANKYRIGELQINKNFGLIEFQWEKETPSMTFKICGLNNTTFQEFNILIH